MERHWDKLGDERWDGRWDGGWDGRWDERWDERWDGRWDEPGDEPLRALNLRSNRLNISVQVTADFFCPTKLRQILGFYM